MLAALALAAACGAWQGSAAGFYPGSVLSGDPLEGMSEKPIDTWIVQTPAGRLQGHYVLHEPTRDVSGTLEPLSDAGEECGVALFRWTDVYGTGVARMVFDPVRHCFEGGWGRAAVEPALVWHACARERVTS